jgi:Tfp pilus assembly ATPase PilU
MQTFDQALLDLARAGLVSDDDARAVASNPHDFGLALRGELAQARAAAREG